MSREDVRSGWMNHRHHTELYCTEQVKNVAKRQWITMRKAARQSETGTSEEDQSSQIRLLSSQVERIQQSMLGRANTAEWRLCYVPCNPVGGVDPPSCMFPASMIISPPSKSHWSVRLLSSALLFIAWEYWALPGHTRKSVWLMFQLETGKREKITGYMQRVGIIISRNTFCLIMLDGNSGKFLS